MMQTIRHLKTLGLVAVVAVVGLTGTACEQKKDNPMIKIDGSSTVYPIMELTQELFANEHPNIDITVTSSGTGGGFKKFFETQSKLRTDINDASRTVKGKEIDVMNELGIEFIELPVAYDGVAVVVHKSNNWVDHLTMAELKKIWEPDSQVVNWSDVRNGWPEKPVKCYGPNGDSGTFEYFTEEVNGKARACRSDYAQSRTEQIVQGIAGDPNSIGFFGYSYYASNKDRLKLVPVDAGKGPISPSPKTIGNLTYSPLSRPLFIYVNKEAAKRPEVKTYIHFFFAHAKEIVENENVSYIALSDKLYSAIKSRFDDLVTGSVYAAQGTNSKSLDELFGK